MIIPTGHEGVSFHVERAEKHLSEMELIQGTGSDWSKVAAFYSAYHTIKAAMLQDPVFEDASLLARASTHLSLSSRSASHHNGRLSAGRGPGVTDIVRFLYRPYYGRYLQLHTASIAVRYGTVESAVAVEQCLLSAHEIYGALHRGELIYSESQRT